MLRASACVVSCTVGNSTCPDQVWIRGCDQEIFSLGAPTGVDGKICGGLSMRLILHLFLQMLLKLKSSKH